jgi:SAM-dependent methyltransferase
MLFVNPRPTESALLELYAGRGGNPFTDPTFESFEDERPGLVSLVARLRGRLPAGRILELGSGRGDLVRVAQEAGFEAEGCDIYGGRPPRHDGLRLHDGFLRDLDFLDACFDGVITRNTLEHLETPASELREIHRILRPGGILYVKVPNARFEHGWLAWLAFGTTNLFEPPWHLNHFRPKDLARLLRRVGFDVSAWETEIPTPLHPRSWKAQLARRAGYWVGEGMRRLTAGTLFPKPIVVCLARRRAGAPGRRGSAT